VSVLLRSARHNLGEQHGRLRAWPNVHSRSRRRGRDIADSAGRTDVTQMSQETKQRRWKYVGKKSKAFAFFPLFFSSWPLSVDIEDVGDAECGIENETHGHC